MLEVTVVGILALVATLIFSGTGIGRILVGDNAKHCGKLLPDDSANEPCCKVKWPVDVSKVLRNPKFWMVIDFPNGGLIEDEVDACSC